MHRDNFSNTGWDNRRQVWEYGEKGIGIPLSRRLDSRQGAHTPGRGVPAWRYAAIPNQPESWRTGTQPYRSRLCHTPRPMVDPRQRGPGQRPRIPHRAAETCHHLPHHSSRHYRGENHCPPQDKEEYGRRSARRRRCERQHELRRDDRAAQGAISHSICLDAGWAQRFQNTLGDISAYSVGGNISPS